MEVHFQTDAQTFCFIHEPRGGRSNRIFFERRGDRDDKCELLGPPANAMFVMQLISALTGFGHVRTHNDKTLIVYKLVERA
jgi:hypothetical protein